MPDTDVSIIIPCYNNRETIIETLQSALGQQGASVQVIVVNDGSTDDTEKVLHKSGLMSKIEYIKQSNAGVSAARNRGLEHARGRYIVFLDADDLLASDYSSKMLGFLNARDLRIGYCNYRYFTHEDPTKKINLTYPKYEGHVQGEIISEHFIPTPGTVLISKDLLKANRFDPDIKGPDDWLLWIQILIREPLGYLPDTLVSIRIRSDSLGRNRDRMHREVVKVMRKVEPLVLLNENLFSKFDIAKFHFRFSGYLIEMGEYKDAFAHWAKGNRYQFHLRSNVRTAAKFVFRVLGVHRKVENLLWQRRERRGGQ